MPVGEVQVLLAVVGGHVVFAGADVVNHKPAAVTKQYPPESFAGTLKKGRPYKLLDKGDIAKRVIPARLNGFSVAINGGNDSEAGALHSKAKAATAAEKVEAGERTLRWFVGHLSQLILISFSTSLNSGSPVTSSQFLTLASAAAKQSA